MDKKYSIHEVATILALVLGDDCACDFSDIDEWLPQKCEYQEDCPNPGGVACWEQFLIHREDSENENI